jgi:hypothetical protein
MVAHCFAYSWPMTSGRLVFSASHCTSNIIDFWLHKLSFISIPLIHKISSRLIDVQQGVIFMHILTILMNIITFG